MNRLAKQIQEAKQFYATRRDWLGEGGHPSPNAQQRANTCLTCPHHNDQNPKEEMLKKAAVRLLLNLKDKMGWHVDGEERLHLCGMCHCLLETKIFVPIDIARENTPDWMNFPDNCWIKTETTSSDCS